MLALQQAVADTRNGPTVQRNSPAYSQKSNGGAKKAIQDVTDLMRRLLLGLEAKFRGRLDLSLPGSRWLIRHTAFVLTRCQVGHDGQTLWRRLIGKDWNGYVFNFGERVMGRLALKKPSADRKATRGKKKLAAGACLEFSSVCIQGLVSTLSPSKPARRSVSGRCTSWLRPTDGA